jgi:hypothetical protein
MNNLANAYAELGDYGQAAKLHVEDLALYQRMMGADSHVAMSMNNLVNTYAALGDHRQAAALYVEVLGLHKRGLGADHPDIAI